MDRKDEMDDFIKRKLSSWERTVESGGRGRRTTEISIGLGVREDKGIIRL